MQISTLPVYSRLADAAKIPADITARLPEGWRLSQHQVETFDALRAHDVDVVINTAMTGDGKSLAAYLPTLVDDQRHAFGMYPTIELSRDQQRQFDHYASRFGRTLACDALWGARLGELAREQSLKRRAEVLKERFENRQVILTNPDIFHLVMNYRYGSGIYSDQELPYSLSINFDDMIFDEFHVFSMPQIVAAVTAMLFLIEYQPGAAPHFLFSSATPDPTFLDMLQRSGLRLRAIGGDYRDTGGEEWRHVLHQADLSLHQLGEREDAEIWLQKQIDLIIDHWRGATRRPRGAIILNSVATARRVAQLLAEQLRPHGIEVGEVTGLTDDGRRRAAMAHADLIVGTSTIDVGVDFNISLLIFEALDAGTFLQRLGRLGRVRQGEPAFDRYEAHALFSPRTPWIYSRVVKELGDRGVGAGAAVDRPGTLREVIQASFPRATTFEPYARRWGILQAAHVIAALEHKHREKGFASLAQTLRARYEKLFNLSSFDTAIRRYWALAGKKQSAQEQQQCQKVLDEVLAFRGGSPFQAAVLDSSVAPPGFISYDALSLAQNANYLVIDEESYSAALGAAPAQLQHEAQEELRWAIKGKNEQRLVLKILTFLQEREGLVLGWEGDLRQLTRQVIACKGCYVSAPRRSHDLDALNQFLRRQLLVCYFIAKDMGELRRELCLPPHFPLYRVEQPQKAYTAAIGKPALLLESVLLRRRGRDEEHEPIFC